MGIVRIVFTKGLELPAVLVEEAVEEKHSREVLIDSLHDDVG